MSPMIQETIFRLQNTAKTGMAKNNRTYINARFLVLRTGNINSTSGDGASLGKVAEVCSKPHYVMPKRHYTVKEWLALKGKNIDDFKKIENLIDLFKSEKSEFFRKSPRYRQVLAA